MAYGLLISTVGVILCDLPPAPRDTKLQIWGTLVIPVALNSVLYEQQALMRWLAVVGTWKVSTVDTDQLAYIQVRLYKSRLLIFQGFQTLLGEAFLVDPSGKRCCSV